MNSAYPLNEGGRILSPDECEALFHRVVRLTTGGGYTFCRIRSRESGNLRWARNRVRTSGNIRNADVYIAREIRGAGGMAGTNGYDDDALRVAVQQAESMVRYHVEDPDAFPPAPPQPFSPTPLWSEDTAELDASDRSAVARRLAEPSVSRKLLSAGYIEVNLETRAAFDTYGLSVYYAGTQAEYSVTVRNPDGTGSGWAGMSHNDWSKIDTTAISERALQKCVASASPRAIEPGRYTLIMEPQAVHDLFWDPVIARSLSRGMAEGGDGPFALKSGLSKLGLQVLDKRLTVRVDPMDPECATWPFDINGIPYRATSWISRGVLTNLAYSPGYARKNFGTNASLGNPLAYIMEGSGTPSTIDEMIENTRRGLLVTRFSGTHLLDPDSLLTLGVTRDGFWLIENGKISFSVKNMRFTESPLFALNNVEAIGKPQRVFSKVPAIVPPIKVRDFNFTSLADAV